MFIISGNTGCFEDSGSILDVAKEHVILGRF